MSSTIGGPQPGKGADSRQRPHCAVPLSLAVWLGQMSYLPETLPVPYLHGANEFFPFRRSQL